MRVHQKAALDLLRAAGAEMRGDDLVRRPPASSSRRATAPGVVPVFDREGEPAMRTGWPAQLLRHRLRPHERLRPADRRAAPRRSRRRRPCRPAVRRARQHRLRHVGRLPQTILPIPHRAYVAEFQAMVTGTTKPMVVTAEGVADLEVMWKIACVVSRRRSPPKPHLRHVRTAEQPAEVSSRQPRQAAVLRRDRHSGDLLAGAALAGATAPITVAGHVAQGVAESLFGLVIHQFPARHLPVWYRTGGARHGYCAVATTRPSTS